MENRVAATGRVAAFWQGWRCLVTGIVILVVSGTAWCQEPTAPASTAPTVDGEAESQRGDRIVVHLLLAIPSLDRRDTEVLVRSIHPSGMEGIDLGMLEVTTPEGTATQQFLVSEDDARLFLVTGAPIDVSGSMESARARLEQRRAGEQKEKERRARAVVAGYGERPVRGDPSAPVTVVEFSDFQCPYCARAAEVVDRFLEKHKGEVRLLYRHLPLPIHSWAKPAAVAAHCAGEQDPDAFWRLHDFFFDQQRALDEANLMTRAREALGGTGIDLERWATCAGDETSEAHQRAREIVDEDLALGRRSGVSATPSFFVGSEFVRGIQSLGELERLLEISSVSPTETSNTAADVGPESSPRRPDATPN